MGSASSFDVKKEIKIEEAQNEIKERENSLKTSESHCDKGNVPTICLEEALINLPKELLISKIKDLYEQLHYSLNNITSTNYNDRFSNNNSSNSSGIIPRSVFTKLDEGINSKTIQIKDSVITELNCQLKNERREFDEYKKQSEAKLTEYFNQILQLKLMCNRQSFQLKQYQDNDCYNIQPSSSINEPESVPSTSNHFNTDKCSGMQPPSSVHNMKSLITKLSEKIESQQIEIDQLHESIQRKDEIIESIRSIDNSAGSSSLAGSSESSQCLAGNSVESNASVDTTLVDQSHTATKVASIDQEASPSYIIKPNRESIFATKNILQLQMSSTSTIIDQECLEPSDTNTASIVSKYEDHESHLLQSQSTTKLNEPIKSVIFNNRTIIGQNKSATIRLPTKLIKTGLSGIKE